MKLPSLAGSSPASSSIAWVLWTGGLSALQRSWSPEINENKLSRLPPFSPSGSLVKPGSGLFGD